MGGLFGLDRALDGLEGLGDDLAAEHAADAAELAWAAVQVGLQLLDVEQGGELGYEVAQ
jgi:hypothetical protein